MADYISIENLEIYANHGVLKEETVLGQKFIISGKLYFDISKAGISDDLGSTVNYAEVCSEIFDLVKNNTFKLIEMLAEKIADEILRKYSMLREVEITVKKPWAPIGLSVECVMVTVSRKWHDAYLSIGSNMGDCEAHLNYVVESLKADDMVKDVKCSSYISTKPYGNVEQDDFLNAAIHIRTLYSPHGLLDRAHDIEQARGRERTIVWGPRTLDVDILFYDDCIIEEDELIIPHPDLVNRDFVLTPMCEIAPYHIHPIYRKQIRELKQELE